MPPDSPGMAVSKTPKLPRRLLSPLSPRLAFDRADAGSPAAALQDLLRLGLIFPEIGSGGSRFEAG